MAGFFSKNTNNKIFLTLDIGTEAVKALFFSLSKKDKKIILISTGLSYYNKGRVFNSRHFELEALEETITNAITNARHNLSFSLADKSLKQKVEKEKNPKILLGLPPNILKARISSQSILRKNSGNKITSKEEEKIYDLVLKSAKKEISDAFVKEIGILPKDIHWFALKMFDIKIDGYQVSGLKGYGGKELNFKVLATFLPSYYWHSIERTINSLGFKIFKTVHLAEILQIVSKEEKSNGMFLDVGGEATQIFGIQNGKLEKVSEFKGGGRNFTAILCEKLGITEEQARNMEEKYSKKALSSGVMKNIKEIFSTERKNWYNSLKDELNEMGYRKAFDSAVFLFGGGSSAPEIKKVLEEDLLNELGKLSIISPPKVTLIKPDDLKNIKDTTKFFNKSQMIPSILICYYSYYD